MKIGRLNRASFAKTARRAMFLFAFAVLGTQAATVATVDGTGYETLEAAIAAAEPVDGVVTYEICGKAEVSATGWIQVLKSGLSNVKKVAFVGTTEDAEICIAGDLAILADQQYDIDVSFSNLKLSKPNPEYGGDYDHSTNYFTTWLRNTGAAENTVTYENCTFPNGACNNQYGKTVYTNCTFANGTTGLYNLWIYGGSVEMDGGVFTGTRGMKVYTEGTPATAPSVEVKGTAFSGLTEKAAIVVSKAATVEFAEISVADCPKGLFQKDIEGSSDDQKVTVTANGSKISGSFAITANKEPETAKTEFNITGGMFTDEVPSDYCADGFTVKATTDADGNTVYGVVEKTELVNYVTLELVFGDNVADEDVVAAKALYAQEKYETCKAANEAYMALFGVTWGKGYLDVTDNTAPLYKYAGRSGSVSEVRFYIHGTLAGFTSLQSSGNQIDCTVGGNHQISRTSYSIIGVDGADGKAKLTDGNVQAYVAGGYASMFTASGKLTIDNIEFTSTTSTTVGASATRATESDTENEVASAEMEIKNCTFRGRLYVYDNFENQGKMTYSIHNCVFDGSNYSGDSNAYAIFAQCKGGNNLVIKDNAIAGFARGINIDHANVHATIEGNTISVTDTGRSCIQLSSLATADIVGNTLELTGGNAITLHEKLLTLGVVPKVSISGNTVTGTGYLVYDDAVANGKAFTSDNLKLTYATDNVVAATVDTTQGVKDAEKYALSGTVATTLHSVDFAAFVKALTDAGYTFDGNTHALAQNGKLTVKWSPVSGCYDKREGHECTVGNVAATANTPKRVNSGLTQFQLFEGESHAVNVKNVAFVYEPAAFTVCENSDWKGTFTAEKAPAGQIYLMNTGDVTFEGCTFDKVVLTSFNCTGTSTVKDCSFKNVYNSYAVKDIRGATISVTGCTFENCGAAVMVSSTVKVGAVTISGNTFKNVDVVGTAPESKVGTRGLVQIASSGDYADTAFDFSDNTATDCGPVLRQLNTTVSFGTEEKAQLNTLASAGGSLYTTDSIKRVVAKVGETAYETLDEAIKAVRDGETIVVNAGEYKLNGSLTYTGKAFTIQAAEGAKVSFDMSGAVALHGAKITFAGVTFDYKTNGNYIGLQHADTLVYNDCTINGMVFLYAASETFNRCTFNQTSAGAYNVWTYGAKEVAFNVCTFNCVGKSVLVYNEGANTKTDLAVSDCEFKASAPVEGKAAIEIDTSLMAGGATITVDAKTTAEGFAEGSNSKSTLWNDKKQTQDTNRNTTVTVAGETVFTPVVAQVGTAGYTTLAAAFAALSAENHTLTLLKDAAWDAATPVYWAAGTQSGYAATLTDALTAAYKANVGAITVVCRPGADVGEMTHGHVADDLTIYGNDAYLSGGECDLEVDTYTFSRATGKQAADGVCLDKDITITAYELDNLGVWGERHTANKVTVNLTDCDGKALEGKTNVQRVYISGTTGVNDITLTDCGFLTKATAVYSNADGAIKAVNCSFTGGEVPFNINHKANGTQTVAVENCTFTNCGDAGDWKQFAAPLRLVNSGTGTQSAEVTGCAFAGTVGANGDILLGDGRTGQASNDVELKVVNTAANIQAQKPGYYNGETVDETKKATATSLASGTLETSVAKLLPVDPRTLGYATSGKAEALPATPDMNGEVVNVTAAQAQYVLDGAYGSIDGKTINFTESINDTLILGRASKYDGSKTVYRHGSHDGEALSYATFIAYKNQSGWTESCFYERMVENVTFTANEGVTVKNFEADGGAHIYAGTAPVYDYVRDTGSWVTEGSCYFKRAILKNITFKGLTFKAKTDINTSESTTVYDGFTFKDCTFDLGTTADGNQAIRYYNENNNGNVKNLVVEGCTFKTCSQGVYTAHVKNVTVTGSTFDTTGHNAIAIQDFKGACDHGEVVITGNTFKGIGDRIIRFNNVGLGTTVTIKDNTADGNSGKLDEATGKREIVKATTLPVNAADSIKASGNNWGANTVVEGVFIDDYATKLGTEACPYSREQFAAMTRAEYIAAQKRLGGTLYVNVGDYAYEKDGVLGNGVRDDTTGQIPDHSKLNAYGENGYLGEKNDGANGHAVVFVGGTITSGVTGYTSIDNIGTSLLLAVPAYTKVTFKETAFKNVLSFNYQLYTSPWSQLGGLTFNGCTFDGIIVGAIAAQELAFNGCTFNNYVNTTDANSSNPTWIRPAYGNWTKGDNEGQGTDFRSLTKITFENNTVTSTRPVKFERIAQWEMATTVTATNNTFAITPQEGDKNEKKTKNVGLYFGANAKFDLVIDKNEKRGETAALYTAEYKAPTEVTYVGLPAGSTVKNAAGKEVATGDGDALAWKTTKKITLKTTTEVASVTNAKGVSVNFATLAEAIAAAQAGETVTLLADITLASKQSIRKELTLDLNGKTLTGTAYQTLSLGSGANVTIQDSSAEKTGKVANGYKGSADPYTICLDGYDAAALTLVSGTVEANPHKTDLQSVAINTNYKKDGPYAINIRGGKVFVPESSTNGRAIVAGENVTLTVEGGEIVGGLHGVDVYGGSTTAITGGSISARVVDTGVIEAAYGLRATGKASVTIGAADGTADAVSVAGIKMDDDGYKLNVPVVTVNSGTIAGPVYSITKGTIGFTVQATSEDVLRFADDTAAKFLPSNLELRAKDIDGKTMYYVAAKPVAAIGAIGYATFADAIAAAKDGETVKLLADVNGDGIAIAPNTFKTGLTVDFGGHTYTVGGLLVGSSGTASNGFQLNAGNKITFKNGAIVGATATAGAGTDWKGAPAILIQNYCDLTLEQMTVKGGDETCYTLSNNNGEIVIDGSTIVAGKGTKYGPFAFDVCRYANYPSVHVTVKGASVIEGNVEISGTIGDNQSRQLDIEEGMFKGAFMVADQPANIAISGGTFATAIDEAYCAAGFIPTANDDGTYGVKAGAYVAAIGTTGYETLEAALAAADAGATVKMLADVVLTEKQTIAKAVVLDLNGKTISSTVNQFITIAKGGDLTVNDATGEGRIENTVTDSSSGRVIFMEGGVLTVNGGTLASNSSKASYYATIEFKNDSYSTVNIAGGRIESIRTANHADGAIKVNAVARATVNVSGGEIVGSKGGIHCLNAYSTINISDGTIIGKNGNAVYSGPYNTITVSGGTLTPGGTAAALAIGGGSCTVTIGREGGVVGDVTIPSIDFEPGYSVNAATVYLFSGIVQKFLDWDKMTVKEPVSQGKDKLLVGTDISKSLPGSDLLCQLDAESGLYEIVKLTVENAVAIVTHDGTETPYRTVEQAVRAVADGDTLTLKVDHTGSQSLSFSAKNVTVDLGGKTLTYTGATGGLSSALSFNQSTASDNTVTVKNGTIVAKAQDATCVRAEMTGDLSKTLTVVFGENLTLTSGNTSRYGGVVFGTGARTASPCKKMTKGGLLVTEGEKQWIYGETETAFTHANGSEVTLLNNWYCTDTDGAIKVPETCAFGSAKLNLDGHTIKHFPYGAGAAIVMGNDAKPSEGTAVKTLEISNGIIETLRHGAAVCGSNKSLTLDGVSVKTTGDDKLGIYANGMTSGNMVTLKNGSAVVSEKATGIYFPGAGTLTVEDSNVTGGVSGIEVRAGVLNVSGTSVIESTATAFDFTNNGNGITTTGAAVAAVKHTVGNDLAVTITGGTFKGPRGFYANDPNVAKPGTVTVSISGGAFSTDVEKKYLADGCKTVQKTIDGAVYYVVGPAVTQIEVTLGDVKKLLPFADDWLTKNIDTEASGWTTAALEEKAANELAKWQCYLFGLDPNKKEAKIVATAGQGTDETIPLAVANADASASPLVTGGYVKVAYVLMGSNDRTAWTQVKTSDKRDGLAIPLTGTTYKFYRVDVTVTSAEGN